MAPRRFVFSADGGTGMNAELSCVLRLQKHNKTQWKLCAVQHYRTPVVKGPQIRLRRPRPAESSEGLGENSERGDVNGSHIRAKWKNNIC